MHNKEQQKAIQFGAGPLLVLAGPGSGKTHVITHRIVHLISECKIPPNQILVITFTKAAALEMQHRATSFYQPCSYVQFGTFHSVFYHILRLSNPDKTYSFAADEERIALIKAVLEAEEGTKNHNINRTQLMQETEACIKAISIYKNKIDTVKTEDDLHDFPEKYRHIYRQYEEWLSENQKLDFDDMIKLCYLQLKTDEKLRAYWQQRFSHILIDEFQDINPLQYETVKLLNGSGNLFVVGDDDQAIYSFRGAKPELMKCFLKEFRAEKICLSVNYRSAAEIIEPAGIFIRHNKERFLKEIKTGNTAKGELKQVFASSGQEVYHLMRGEILRFRKEFPQKTQAILVRTNALAYAYRDIAKEKQADRVLSEDMAAYLSFINCGQKRSDFLKIMNKPVRYLSASLLTEEIVDFELLIKRLKDKPWILKRVCQLREQIIFAAKLDFAGQARYVYHAMGYGDYYENNIKNNSQFLFGTNLCENSKENKTVSYDFGIKKELKVLFERLRECKSMEEFQNRYVKEQIDQGKKTEQAESGLRIMTYHASKGLEFDRVYLPGLEYGRVPHGRMLLTEELEEERRMFYVAMTRAKESLWLFCDKSQTGSPFLDELV